jgi:addiction module HigA family antidote
VVTLPTNRPPTHPGGNLLEEYLKPLGLSQRDLANTLRVPYWRINDIVNGRLGLTADTAMRLAKFFNTTPEYWMRFQWRLDLWGAAKKNASVIDSIPAYTDRDAAV